MAGDAPVDIDEAPEPPAAAAAEVAPTAVADSETSLLEAIEQTLEEINLGFDYEVLNVLDDEEARPSQIEPLKDQLGSLISARLFSLANSVHYGKIRSGHITSFVDVVKHLGTETTKSTAIFIALMGLSDTRETREVFARNYATSQLADVIAGQLGVGGKVKSRIALGGLFLEIGKIIIMLHGEKTGCEIDKDFIDRHHRYIGTKVIETFALPEVLSAIISQPHFTFIKKENLGTLAIVHMAHSVVETSFTEHGKLVFQSAMPDPEGILYKSTVGSVLSTHFQIMGLGGYLKVIPTPYSDQEKRLLEKYAENAPQ
jgi:hypothetical protein